MLAFVSVTSAAVGDQFGNSGCQDENCFPECMSQQYMDYGKQTDKQAATSTCLDLCYKDPCQEFTSDGIYPKQCKGKTGKFAGHSSEWGKYNKSVSNCDYVCGSCKPTAGYGPSGTYFATAFSRIPDGLVTEKDSGHRWNVSMTFDDVTYNALIKFQRTYDWAASLWEQTISNFEFQCKQPYKLIRDQQALKILLVENGVWLSDCMHGNLTEHNLEFVMPPTWVSDDSVAFRFKHQVPKGQNEETGKTYFYENDDIVYTILQKQPDQHDQRHDSKSKKHSKTENDIADRMKKQKVWVDEKQVAITLGCIFTVILFLGGVFACTYRNKTKHNPEHAIDRAELLADSGYSPPSVNL